MNDSEEFFKNIENNFKESNNENDEDDECSFLVFDEFILDLIISNFAFYADTICRIKKKEFINDNHVLLKNNSKEVLIHYIEDGFIISCLDEIDEKDIEKHYFLVAVDNESDIIKVISDVLIGNKIDRSKWKKLSEIY